MTHEETPVAAKAAWLELAIAERGVEGEPTEEMRSWGAQDDESTLWPGRPLPLTEKEQIREEI